MLKVDRANAVITRDAISRADPDITPAVMQEMIDDILSQSILSV